MALTGGSLSGADYRSTRAVKEHPNHSFHSPCDQGIDHHGKEGGEFQYHAASSWCGSHAFKGEQEKGRKPIDQGHNRAPGVGADQFESDAERNEGFEDAQEQPDQLGNLKSEDALFAFRFLLN